MKRYLYALRYLISIHVLGLILFTAFRLILFLQGYEYLMDEEISVFTRLEAFVRGLWLDNVVACYISDSATRYRLDLFPDRIFR